MNIEGNGSLNQIFGYVCAFYDSFASNAVLIRLTGKD